MVKWIIIALIPIALFLIIEEAVQFLLKRYMNGPREKKEGKRKERLAIRFHNVFTSIKEYQLLTAIKDSRLFRIVRESKFISFFRKHRKDPSH
ncbi:hypothetical protein [Mesobacillus maritimus]|uniref:Uncharacterized protein n=1 Tax=Mesobacillus maritimus TaxID=1643336 RepID=A0ABS7K048_9BACI|nr:hypothetical protein [Mesobacillus maritimus]MBY0095579.1 hypothetical protein [Mesobacillus maritimus]